MFGWFVCLTWTLPIFFSRHLFHQYISLVSLVCSLLITSLHLALSFFVHHPTLHHESIVTWQPQVESREQALESNYMSPLSTSHPLASLSKATDLLQDLVPSPLKFGTMVVFSYPFAKLTYDKWLAVWLRGEFLVLSKEHFCFPRRPMWLSLIPDFWYSLIFFLKKVRVQRLCPYKYWNCEHKL